MDKEGCKHYAKVVLSYNEKEYKFDFPYELDENHPGGRISLEELKEAIEFNFEEGNYSCDCNRSIFIKRYCDHSFLEMDCGEKINLEKIEF